MADDLDRLFRLYHRDLQNIAYRRLGDRELAADLTQDTFVRYAGLGQQQQTDGILNPRFFLIRVLGNLIIDLARGRKRQGSPVELSEVQDELLDPRPGPERLFELRQQLQCLHLALSELPENCRTALLLNRIEGLSHQAIAERLEVSPSMVSKYIMRALRHCVRSLELLED
ncbi:MULTISPECIES: RNA polymerase sigma factor [unclassified Pseudomonas]|uniref:RNA polymerase sigma factor n=1 Tax=unclassified Pseudomonas TaxID=196821 RepID=UPI000BA38E0C|nr:MULTISPECIES: RNA polymerase sigma factor [unclassified Pseudomonas]MCU1725142.1 RNA polymerase sigma factor [Pseudomonas sp. 5P_5.1_Bac1]MCU1733485.1 RNA polymerase sigma factor [Pseudomonas sp. 20P_3.2_Bac4]MCU1744311.1 RNA polymerase sigma factor [Pseudomonas sp. 20P_3.2_Bac5]